MPLCSTTGVLSIFFLSALANKITLFKFNLWLSCSLATESFKAIYGLEALFFFFRMHAEDVTLTTAIIEFYIYMALNMYFQNKNL